MRHPVDLPVFVTISKNNTAIRVPGRVSELSEGGMAVYAGIQMVPGDLMRVEFQTPGHTQVEAVVRNKAGCCFGVEFLDPLAGEGRRPPARPTASGSALSARSQAELGVMLRKKEQEIQRLRNEIDVLQAIARRNRT